jgi:hypothetical protein
MEATMFVLRAFPSDRLPLGVLPAPSRGHVHAAPNSRLRRARARDIAKAGLALLVMAAAVTAIVLVKWVVWGGYFNH